MKTAIVIGSGFSGLSTATCLAAQGLSVKILEKNESPGGRASKFEENGFLFDMGPSWYWMPDVFEHYFDIFGKKPSDYYDLERLDPAYRIYWGEEDFTDIPASMSELESLFESMEKGSAAKLRKFLNEAEYKYKAGITDLVYRPSAHITDFFDFKLLPALFRLQLFSSLQSHVHELFQHDKIRKILEFPVYFLGALPKNTPALYSLMNYADLKLGTWYPKGGMWKIVDGMVQLAKEKGVEFEFDCEVEKLITKNGRITEVFTTKGNYEADFIIASADYHHVEQHLLEKENRKYEESYWDSRVMAPGSLIFYLGVDAKIPELQHHNLFFDTSFEMFGDDIYTKPQWPRDPMFYVCCPSKTDTEVAPAGKENLFILMPVAPGLDDAEEIREEYYEKIMDRLEKYCGYEIRSKVIFKKSFAHKEFKERYHAYKGNAYGLANTLMQTAILKPSLRNPKVKNLYYTGQLTVPGPGVPPSLISGQVVASEVLKDMGKKVQYHKAAW